MAACIEETKQSMIKQTDEQLQAKTKRTIIENEQLNRELGFQIKHTEALLHKNEKLVEDNIELHRQILLAEELEEDLARRNEAHQKTMRILLFKLHEKHLATKLERKMEEKELQELISHNEALKADVQEEEQHLKILKDFIAERSRDAESSGAAEEAMKFLYACLEDLEVEWLLTAKADSCVPSSDTTYSFQDNMRPILPNALDQLNHQQRKDFLKHLICTAVTLRAVTHNFNKAFDSEEVDLLFNKEINNVFTKAKTRGTILSMEDILALPVGSMLLDEPVLRPDGSKVWIKSVCSGVQTDLLENQEKPSEGGNISI
ncbi:hypothetical protein O6H91_01G090000 [Diphasiastrum complanatum]|uniref:Uncharacterized protein n=4 Tax=Diphasiastrum complanatum TaxID=34168 RepID=A0ACC2ET90_DIPCM|nr:hypothetical protein O6H91_01G084600 [Diphasiastrum complanatum]KAJ7569578.1 hypothetical protein O6H91_01G084600 [Diphasiastrum complanatum]KAJ7569715.1 hypothetical protein O6H91_01G090000 [Diphasiastrum complanatum]KAJ7569719.1 hypothetical protein O6H91_01G090000 [Diphasiastrum complanatum]